MNDAISGVYWIRNKVNNHIYIGSSKNVRSRIHNHKNQLCRQVSHHRLLQDAVNEYGIKNFSCRVLITCHPDMLFWYEQQFIDQWHPEYNIYPFADSPRGSIPNIGTTGYKFSAESRAKMSASHMGHAPTKGFTGHKFSKESIAKISAAGKGRVYSDESKHKMSEARKRWWALRRAK
jgi:group I intron endonuclease